MFPMHAPNTDTIKPPEVAIHAREVEEILGDVVTVSDISDATALKATLTVR